MDKEIRSLISGICHSVNFLFIIKEKKGEKMVIYKESMAWIEVKI